MPKYLSFKISYVRDKHKYNTRRVNDFHLEFRRCSFTQNSLHYKGLKMFNELPT